MTPEADEIHNKLMRISVAAPMDAEVIGRAASLIRAQSEENERLRDALLLGREAVVESFEHAKSHDDKLLAEARLRDIDAALKT